MSGLTAWLIQPSTVRGIVQLASVAGIALNPAHIIWIATVGGGIIGLINLIKKDASGF